MTAEEGLLSLIIPSRNEPALQEGLTELLVFFQEQEREVEILVVDDSDPDQARSLWAYCERHPAKLRFLPGDHLGKGAAVRKAFLAARGSTIAYLDADLPVELAQVLEVIDLVAQGEAEIAIAERTDKFMFRTPIRAFLSLGLFVLQRAFVFNNFKYFDTQCGMKAFQGRLGRQMADRQHTTGGMFDIELLYIAERNRARVIQVPVKPRVEVRPSRINVLKCIWRDPLDILLIKFRGLAGRYDLP